MTAVIPEGGAETYRGMTLTSFALSETEITVADYERVMETELEASDGLPVTSITWYEAAAFCDALSRMFGFTRVYGGTGSDPAYSKSGFYLPTEAQWEYAAGGSEHYGYSLSDTFVEGDYVFAAEGPEGVKSRAANSFGLFGMSGNAAEWCGDYYISDADFPGIHQGSTDPVNPLGGVLRVVRGGSWMSTVPVYLSCESRLYANPAHSSAGTGFRVALGGFGKW